MEDLFSVPQGNFKLERLPKRKNEQLKAWDAADEYLLDYLFENVNLSSSTNLLILNDSFGALAVALNVFNPVSISDSFVAQQATETNLESNHIPLATVQINNSLDWPELAVDVVLIKAPKTLALLEDQLIRLQALLKKETLVIAAGMVRVMSSSVWKLMARYLGETRPSLAKKKARLIFTSLDSEREIFINPYPTFFQLEDTNFLIANHANVFSREKLDIGTRFLIEHLPKNTPASKIVDLACGNGVVGLILAENHPAAHLFFVDESYMAVASAKQNFNQAFPEKSAEYSVSDGLMEFKIESMDLIVCNPPFHQQNTVGNQIALSLFKQSYQVLQKRGELWVIGNRHLGYHLDLKRIFKQVKQIASNNKFVIWRVIK